MHLRLRGPIDATSDGERRFGVRYKQVLIDMTKTQSIPWPAEWRARIVETMA